MPCSGLQRKQETEACLKIRKEGKAFLAKYQLLMENAIRSFKKKIDLLQSKYGQSKGTKTDGLEQKGDQTNKRTHNLKSPKLSELNFNTQQRYLQVVYYKIAYF